MPDRVKLTEAQRDALGWLHHDGSERDWGGKDCGHPAIAALDAIVRKGFARKSGGNGCTPRYSLKITKDERRVLLASNAKGD